MLCIWTNVKLRGKLHYKYIFVKNFKHNLIDLGWLTEVCQGNISSTIWLIKCRFDSAGIISRGRDVISGRENSNAVQKLRTRSTGPVAISSPKHANANWIYFVKDGKGNLLYQELERCRHKYPLPKQVQCWIFDQEEIWRNSCTILVVDNARRFLTKKCKSS